jgi:CBS domain containing-hemolysin-like protein
LRTIVEVSHEEGVIESEERQMITNVVDFGDSLAKDVMVPRMDVELVSNTLSYDELMAVYLKDKFTRMPVYNDTSDNIVGTLNLKDVFFYQGNQHEFDIKNLMRKPFFTYDYKKTSELFMEMRKECAAMSIVLDEYGTFVGIVTLEDLIEEIVGEIRDEYDVDEEDSVQCVAENEYIANGVTNLSEVNEALGITIEATDYDSIAGHIINLLEHLPSEGEIVEDEFAVYTVLAVEKNRIDKVHILVKTKTEDIEEG